MRQLAELLENIAATSAKTEKRRLVSEYLANQPLDVAAAAAVFLSGRPFPAFEEWTLQVGGNLLWQVVAELSGATPDDMSRAYRAYGDLGSAAAQVLASHLPSSSNLSISNIREFFDVLATTRGASTKQAKVRDLFSISTALEAKYIVKIMTGDLRVGLRENLVEEAIALAFAMPLAAVRRANMLLGDIGETLHRASAGTLQDSRMRLFHPIGFMLASPAESAEEAFSAFPEAHVHIEDKYDGIRAQIHGGDPARPGEVRIFSRTLDDITASFPELAAGFAGLRSPIVLDGEIVGWEITSEGPHGRAMPFSELQKRLGRKQVSADLLRSVPVAFVGFDVLFANGELLIDRPLRDRIPLLDEIAAQLSDASRLSVPEQIRMFDPRTGAEPVLSIPVFVRAPFGVPHSAHEVELLFELARARGNEGLMVKDPASPYAPGRRGNSWLKLKRELATLDVVITEAEYGNGRRAQWLSDYTFAIRDGECLLNIGKAYSGVTDAEIVELTAWCKEHTLADYGHRRQVEPRIVLEVAFNNIMRSDRHDSGYALRFPRIVRLRRDKTVEQINTLEEVRRIFERQQDPRPSH